MEIVKNLDTLVQNDLQEPPHLLLYVVEGRFDVLSKADGKSCEMDAVVWSRLPEEMVERVLAMLPVEAQFRCRAVCQKWRELIPSGRFQLLAASLYQHRPTAPVLCAFEYRPGLSRGRCPYGSARISFPMFTTRNVQHKVYKLDLTFLPAMFRKWQHNRIVCEDGLICVKVSDPPNTSSDVVENFCVFNPVTREWKVLPHLNVQQHRWGVMKVQADRVYKGEFHVTLVCGPDNVTDRHVVEHLWTTAVYSSNAGVWKLIKANVAAAPIANCRSVLCSGMVYCMRERNNIILHGMDDAKLSTPMELATPVHGLGLFEFQLIQHEEELLLVGQFDYNNLPSFGIWKLDRKKSTWDLVTEVPRDLHDRLVKPVLESGQPEISMVSFGGAVKVGNIVFIIIFVTEQPKDFSSHFILKTWTHVIAFNILEQVWDIYFENAGDLVSTVWSTPSGFIELRMNDFL